MDWRVPQGMSDTAARFRNLSRLFLARARQVPGDAWDNPAPCEGWVARDVVRHLVEWVPAMILAGPGLPLPEVPDVDRDPVGAWTAVSDAIEAALDNSEVAGREFEMRPGRFSVRDAVATFVLADVLIHTWDLSRAAGLDETLDPVEVRRALNGMSQVDPELLVNSGQYGPAVPVPEDADEQTRLIALTGRTP